MNIKNKNKQLVMYGCANFDYYFIIILMEVLLNLI